jgi:transposase
MVIIAFDAHKRYTIARVEDPKGKLVAEGRIDHVHGEIRRFLAQFDAGSTVAVETIGNWYWIVDEIESAGMRPALVHALRAKKMMCNPNKTDKLDAKGLNRLQRAGTLPEVWIPPADIRDKRDLARTRMMLSCTRGRLKNRIHAVLAKYALHDFGEASDIFGKRVRPLLEERIEALPPETRFSTRCMMRELESIEAGIGGLEQRMREVFGATEEIELLKTLPGVGFLLGVVIAHEAGAIDRFPGPGNFASYSGTTPRVHASGGKVRFGPARADANRYLKWAFAEAANAICTHRKSHPTWHVSRLYERIKARKGHAKAIGAVSRHLAEAAYWVLRKREPYREPVVRAASSREA